MAARKKGGSHAPSKSDYRKLTKSELIERGYSSKSERYLNKATGKNVSKRQYQQTLLTGGKSLERRAKDIKSGVRQALFGAPQAARQARLAGEASNTRMKVHEAMRYMAGGDSLEKAAAKAGVSSSTERKQGVKLGLFEKTVSGRYVPSGNPYRKFTVYVSTTPDGIPVLHTLILDAPTASKVGRWLNDPSRYQGQAIHTLTGETFYLSTATADIERARRRQGGGSGVTYQRTESLDNALPNAA